MTRAEARAFLTQLGIAEPTEQQITSYLDSVADNATTRQTRSAADQQELERLKEVEKLYNKSKDDSQAHEATVKELNKRMNRMIAESILQKSGMSAEEYADFVDSLIADTEEDTKKRAEALSKAFSSKLESQKNTLEQEFQDKLKDYTPNPNGAGGKGDDKPEDVKNVETINFGTVNKDAQASRDYYK